MKAAADTELYDLEKHAIQIDIDKHEYDNSSENTDDNSSPHADDNASQSAEDNSERSQNTVLLASTQAVYKAPHNTVPETETESERDTETHCS